MDGVVQSRRLLWGVTAVGVGGLLLVGMYGWLFPALLLTPDSLGYINWHPIRSPGYPAFLSLWRYGTVSFVGIGLVQGALLISATCFLAHSVGVVTRRTWPAVIFGIVVLALAPLWKWTTQVRPETLFIVFVEVFFGAAARALVSRRPSWGIIGGVGLCRRHAGAAGGGRPFARATPARVERVAARRVGAGTPARGSSSRHPNGRGGR